MDIKRTQKIQHSKGLSVEPILPASAASEDSNPGQDADTMQKSGFATNQAWLEELQTRQSQIEDQWTGLFESSKQQIEDAKKNLSKMEVKPQPVPSTIGLTLRTASKLLSKRGFRIAVTTAEHSESIPEGHVVMTVPMPGASAMEDSGIKIILSKGPPPEGKEKSPQELIALGDPSESEREKKSSSTPVFMSKSLIYPSTGKLTGGGEGVASAIEIKA